MTLLCGHVVAWTVYVLVHVGPGTPGLPFLADDLEPLGWLVVTGLLIISSVNAAEVIAQRPVTDVTQNGETP